MKPYLLCKTNWKVLKGPSTELAVLRGVLMMLGLSGANINDLYQQS
jgi:hypothetical protein